MPEPASSSTARLLLLALAILTALGVVLISTRLGQPERKPAAQVKPAAPAASPPVGADAPAPPNALAAAAPPTAAPAPAKSALPATAGQAADQASGAPAALPAPPTVGQEALTDPPSAEEALAPGEPATARVTVGGVSTPMLSLDQAGAFPRVYLPLGGQADVQVRLPEAAPGDRVVAAVEDGGSLAGGQAVQAFTLDESRQIRFPFQASQSLGTFRVSVRHNAQTKIVTFWAGERAAASNY